MSPRIRSRRVGHQNDDAAPHLPSGSRPKQSALGLAEKTIFRAPKRTCFKMFAGLLVILFIIFGVIPVVFRTSSLIKNAVVFMNIFNYWVQTPDHYGLKCTRNFSINSSDKVHLGVWHVAPQDQCTVDTMAFADLVVLYVHGIGGSRGSTHRVALYKLLSNKLKAHVIAFDYRGYGDSSNLRPNAEGLVKDTAAIYNWLIHSQGVAAERILIWSHSLGTAVVTRFLSELSPEEKGPKGAVLEAPFTNMRQAISSYPLAKLYSWVNLLYFEYFFVAPLVENSETNFDSAALMSKVRTPLLILHAQDDRIVPFYLGRRLFEIAQKDQPATVARPRFHSFAAKGYGHKNIVNAEELPGIVKDFIRSIV